jgi:hypothetical protein
MQTIWCIWVNLCDTLKYPVLQFSMCVLPFRLRSINDFADDLVWPISLSLGFRRVCDHQCTASAAFIPEPYQASVMVSVIAFDGPRGKT